MSADAHTVTRLLLRAALGLLAAIGHAQPPPVAEAAAKAAAVPQARWCDLLPRPEFASLERVPSPDPWFEVYRVEPGVFAIAEPRQFQEVISWLILGKRRALLLDTGLGMRPIRPVVESLTSLPVMVLNSHTHYDHVGGNAEFESVLATTTPYTKANQQGFPNPELAGEVSVEAFCTGHPAGLDPATWHTRPWRSTGTVHDGCRSDLGDRRLEVLAVPGHTPDSLALLDRKVGLLWTGDTFYAAPIWLYVPETDLDAYQKSVERLVKLVPSLRRLLGAHNVAASSPSQLVALQTAIREVRAGRARGEADGPDRRLIPFDGFSILVSTRALGGERGDTTRGGSGLTRWPEASGTVKP